MKRLKICYKISFVISLTALVVGSLFHRYRLHPENTSNYNLGVSMGISMLSMFLLFLVVGILLLIIYRNKMKK